MIYCFPSPAGASFLIKALLSLAFSQFSIFPEKPTAQYIYSHTHSFIYPSFHLFLTTSDLYSLNRSIIHQSTDSCIQAFTRSSTTTCTYTTISTLATYGSHQTTFYYPSVHSCIHLLPTNHSLTHMSTYLSISHLLAQPASYPPIQTFIHSSSHENT